MNNKIIYGAPGTGKTHGYFYPTIKGWKGKVIAVTCINREIEGFKSFNLDDPRLTTMIINKTTNLDLLEEIFSYNKILLVKISDVDPFGNNDSLKNIIKYLLINMGDFENPLLAIDEFFNFNLSEKYRKESLLLSLLKSDKITTLFIVQDLRQIADLYDDNYTNIVNLCEIISTRRLEDYSGELRVRFPNILHKYLAEQADKHLISLNLYIVDLLTKCMNQLTEKNNHNIEKQNLIKIISEGQEVIILDPEQ